MKFAFAIIAIVLASALLLAGCVFPPEQPPAPPSPPGNDTPPAPPNNPPADEMTQALCESARGHWNECASACRGAPEGTACTLQCVQQCECGGIAGFGCPAKHHCSDYLPVGAADAMGVCKKNIYQ